MLGKSQPLSPGLEELTLVLAEVAFWLLTLGLWWLDGSKGAGAGGGCL